MYFHFFHLRLFPKEANRKPVINSPISQLKDFKTEPFPGRLLRRCERHGERHVNDWITARERPVTDDGNTRFKIQKTLCFSRTACKDNDRTIIDKTAWKLPALAVRRECASYGVLD